MDKFLLQNNIPKYLEELLSLAGVFIIADLVEIDEDFLKGIEEDVRQQRYNDQVDFSSKQNRVKYFGSDYSNLELFSLRSLDSSY